VTTATQPQATQERVYQNSRCGDQGVAWRREALQLAFDQQVAYTAKELCEHGVLHLFAVPTTSRMAFRFVCWNCQENDFYCSEHAMHACECSGAALQALMQRGLLPRLTSDEPGELEANAQVWRAANS
jgi:hypothetical protein